MYSIRRFAQDENGATAIEYVLIAGAMGLALIATMPYLGSIVQDKLSSIAGHISSSS